MKTTFREDLPFELTRSVDDQDPAFRVWYDGDATPATYDMDTGTDTITVTIGTGVFTFDLNTYSDVGSLVDALRNIDPFFHLVMAAARRDDATIGGGVPFLIDSGPNDLIALGTAGFDQFWDTSVCKFRKVAVGMEEVAQLKGRDLIAAERRSDNTNDVVRDPDIGDTLHRGKMRVNARGANLETIIAKASFGSGSTTVKMSKCGQHYDGAEIELGTLVTATSRTFRDELGVDGIESQDGERIVVEVEDTTTAPTSSSITVVGAIGSIV